MTENMLSHSLLNSMSSTEEVHLRADVFIYLFIYFCIGVEDGSHGVNDLRVQMGAGGSQ